MKLFRFIMSGLLALCLIVMPVVSSANAGSTTAPTPAKSLPTDFKFPPIGEIAKRMVSRANVVNYAVESLLGAVDWVLDPANNQAKIKFPTPTSVCRGSYLHYKWIGTADYVAESYCKAINRNQSKHIFGEWNRRGSTTYSRATCAGGYGGSTFVDCGLPVEETSIPLNVIAEQIIQNAQAGHAESVDFVVDVANELKKQTGAKPIASANANEDTDTSNPDKEKDDKEPKNNDCKNKISDWELKQNGFDAHDLKSIVGSNVQRYELCKCKNKEIVIREKGCKGGIIPTGEFLK
ncbi:polymorphic toxin type 33 domain-containing protein [Moraxella sp. ZY210820]|uniref:polymorphic toxin type 33 domain-containing protein n=1 Tax=unclassified Moraxella TaxID=2685852 RepID=UPI002731F7EE|nr:polymorphic toxin type 33 domain-containing protein [Moraxella sp. ZY210820]WLF84650.1 polymorphic toxin type 33 domain-containing protein [Moraxella sp. ZY210820]